MYEESVCLFTRKKTKYSGGYPLSSLDIDSGSLSHCRETLGKA